MLLTSFTCNYAYYFTCSSAHTLILHPLLAHHHLCYVVYYVFDSQMEQFTQLYLGCSNDFEVFLFRLQVEFLPRHSSCYLAEEMFE